MRILPPVAVQGGAWRVLDIIEPLEQDLRVPVIHPSSAKAVQVKRRTNVR